MPAAKLMQSSPVSKKIVEHPGCRCCYQNSMPSALLTVIRLVDDAIDDDILCLEIHDAVEGWVAQQVKPE